MKSVGRIALILLGLSLPGCSFYRYAYHNACHDIHQSWNVCHEKRRNKQMAEAAWLRISPACPLRASVHFAEGFRVGYIDFANEDGTGEPPLAPPAKYWKVEYQNPAGRAAVLEWNDGFRAGAAAARADGVHEYHMIPAIRPIIEPVDLGRSVGVPAHAAELPPPRLLLPMEVQP